MSPSITTAYKVRGNRFYPQEREYAHFLKISGKSNEQFLKELLTEHPALRVRNESWVWVSVDEFLKG